MKTNSSNLWTQYLTVYSLSWAKLWGKSCKLFKQILIFFCHGTGERILKQLRCDGRSQQVNKWIAGSRICHSEKKGLSTIEWGEVKKNSVGMNWNWGCQCKFIISTICTHVCNVCNMCAFMSAHSYIYQWVYIYVDIF